MALAWLFALVPALASLLLGLNLLFGPARPDAAKASPYECGFSPVYGQTRTVFHIHFYVVAMLFLVFDLEILLLFPVATVLHRIDAYGCSVALLFFAILTLGFVLEIGSGAIRLTDPRTGLIAAPSEAELDRLSVSLLMGMVPVQVRMLPPRREDQGGIEPTGDRRCRSATAPAVRSIPSVLPFSRPPQRVRTPTCPRDPDDATSPLLRRLRAALRPHPPRRGTPLPAPLPVTLRARCRALRATPLAPTPARPLAAAVPRVRPRAHPTPTPLPLRALDRTVRLALLRMGLLASRLRVRWHPRPHGATLTVALLYFRRASRATPDAPVGDPTALAALAHRLTRLCRCHVTLACTRLHRDHGESHILAQSLGLQSHRHRFLKLATALFQRLPALHHEAPPVATPDRRPSRLVGLTLRLGGRTPRQRIVPRKTVQTLQRGSLARDRACLDVGHFTSHTKRGTYRFTVRATHAR